MKTVLVVDDDVQIGNMLNEALTREGYAVLRAYSGTEALMVLQSRRPDLILLDLMLPGMSGEEVLPKIKGIPVIVCSAKSQVADKVSLLLGGAVDYITKPFAIEELLARITAALRKTQAAEPDEMTCGDISLSCVSHSVTVRGEGVSLTKTEFAILKLLMINDGKVIAKSVILDRIAADTPDCTERSLKQHISNLRKKLSAVSGEDYIEAVWGIGFKLRY